MASFFQKSLKLIDSASSSLTSSSNRDTKTRYLNLNDGLSCNTKIIIDGKVLPAASKYEINLWCGSVVNDELLKNGNIALHFMVNPSAGQALLNSKSGKTWGHEERTTRGRLPKPLLQNQSFKLCIEVESNHYRIDVNDIQFVTFLHRHPFETVGLLSYCGDFDIENVQLQLSSMPCQSTLSNQPMLPLGPELYMMPNNSNDHLIHDIKMPKLPFLLPIKAGLCVGMIISIDGLITGNRFDLSFYQGSNPYGDINTSVAFHMEIYMKEQSIVRNSFEQNEWRTTERTLSHFPFFTPLFQMQIRIEGNRYQIIVGGRYVFDFYHRITALNTIDHLCVHGAVDVHRLTVIVPPL